MIIETICIVAAAVATGSAWRSYQSVKRLTAINLRLLHRITTGQWLEDKPE